MTEPGANEFIGTGTPIIGPTGIATGAKPLLSIGVAPRKPDWITAFGTGAGTAKAPALKAVCGTTAAGNVVMTGRAA